MCTRRLIVLALMLLAACGEAETGAGAGAGTGTGTGAGAGAGTGAGAGAGTGAGADADADALPDLTGWNVGEGHLGIHTLAWRVRGGGAIPRNRDFDLEVILLRGDEPQPGARLALSGMMPAHNHGFIQTPFLEEVGRGRYAVTGMLLHMRGNWQVRFQIFPADEVSKNEVVTWEFDL